MSNDSEADAEEAADAAEAAPDAETAEAEAVDTAEDASEEETTDGLEEGDFVEIDYTARTVEDDRLVDTTDEEVAEEAEVEADQEFGPRTIVLGEGHVFPSVEDDIVGTEIGDTGSVVVPASEAFGEYDDEEVRTVSKDKIPEDDQYPGANVRIEGDEGFVETIIGGRARVDFNHPLAGDDIEYEWEVVDTVDDREEQASGLIEMLLDMELNVWFQTDTVEEEQLVEDDEDEGAEEEAESEDDGEADSEDADDDEEDEGPTYETVEVEKESLYIEATPELTMNQQWMMGKQQIGQQLTDLLGVDRVVVQEIIEGGGMPGMMGMGGGMGGGGGGEELEAALEEADIDADELADEL
jgi:FKBP-type peptidyl-prolyl cis-trans isomerase SlyD